MELKVKECIWKKKLLFFYCSITFDTFSPLPSRNFISARLKDNDWLFVYGKAFEINHSQWQCSYEYHICLPILCVLASFWTIKLSITWLKNDGLFFINFTSLYLTAKFNEEGSFITLSIGIAYSSSMYVKFLKFILSLYFYMYSHW